MELHDFATCGLGYSLTVEEEAALETQLARRRMDERLHSIKFWGRVCGTTCDYLVVCGLTDVMESPHKKFFFATTKNLTLQEMPVLTDEFAALAAGIASRFTGNPAKLLGPDAEDGDAEEEAEEEVGEDGVPKPKKARFSEAHRLAASVTAIDADTSVVPRGAFTVTPTHHIVPSATFTGLSATEAADMSAYAHFRASAHPVRKHALSKVAVVGAGDFLDPITDDAPRGVWALRVDAGSGQVSVRSLKWPGYFFFHKIATPVYGGVYIGDGRANADLQFMM